MQVANTARKACEATSMLVVAMDADADEVHTCGRVTRILLLHTEFADIDWLAVDEQGGRPREVRLLTIVPVHHESKLLLLMVEALQPASAQRLCGFSL